jgi:UDP-GlcNAc:undecaprenyl-phosphate GlcNAc-1-phosphate transferase
MALSVKLALALMLAIGIPLVCTPLVKRLALFAGAVDKPGGRKQHNHIQPAWGGLGIYIGVAAGALVALPADNRLLGLLGGGLLIMLVGMIDDWYQLSPAVKLAGQVAAAAVLVASGVQAAHFTNPFGGTINLGIFGVPVTIIWVVAIINAINLVDGLDGLAAGVAVISAVTVAILANGSGAVGASICALLLAAACLGFLPYNYHPAKIFMGDTGSMFIGYMLASLATFGLTKSATAFSLILPILILGLPILDMLFAIVRRVINGQAIFRADRDHLHHRLLAMGLTHRQTVLVIYGLNLLLGASAVVLTHLTTDQGLLMLFVLLVAILYAANRVNLFSVKQPVNLPASQKSNMRGIGL